MWRAASRQVSNGIRSRDIATIAPSCYPTPTCNVHHTPTFPHPMPTIYFKFLISNENIKKRANFKRQRVWRIFRFNKNAKFKIKCVLCTKFILSVCMNIKGKLLILYRQSYVKVYCTCSLMAFLSWSDSGPGVCAAPWLLPQERLEHHGLCRRSYRVGLTVLTG